MDGKISDSCSNKSSTTDYSSIRPLISKSGSDKYDTLPPNCKEHYSYDHNLDPCSQYIQIRPLDYRVRPSYPSSSVLPMPNLPPNMAQIPNIGHMSLNPNDCHILRPQYDKVYEDWLKYKNALPLNTSGLVSK